MPLLWDGFSAIHYWPFRNISINQWEDSQHEDGIEVQSRMVWKNPFNGGVLWWSPGIDSPRQKVKGLPRARMIQLTAFSIRPR